MPCVYDKGYNFECQFDFPEDELIEVDGKQWCPYHAPLKDKGKNPTEKGKWTDEETLQFYKKILKLCESALAETGKRLNLRGVVFPGKAYFQGLEFPEVDFSDAKFNGDADFSDSTFRGSVYFRKVKFYGYETTFRKARFEKSTDFRKAKFIGGNADFSEARFMDEEIYGGGNFFSKVKFIGGDTNFRNAEFRKIAEFKKVKFKGSAIFTEAEFKSGTIFNKARFKWSALFNNSQFNGNVYFEMARFNGKVDFISSRNNDDTNNTDAFDGEVHFEGAEFLGEPIFEVTFENRKFQQKTSFRDCTFEKAPRFHGCRLHQDTDFTDARFWDRQGDEAIKAYRTLKLDMEEKRAREEQLRFYALEMKSRRHTEKRTLIKFLSWLYEKTSDYGQSVSRPLLWLGASYFIFATIYTVFFNEFRVVCLGETDILNLSFRFSLEQIFSPFGAFDLSSLFQPYRKTLAEISPSHVCLMTLRVIAALQSFLSLALLLLSGLAARWRFKIG